MAALPALGTLAFAPGAAASVPPLDLSLDEIIKMNKKQGKKQGAKVRVAQAHNAQRWAASLESRLAQSAFCVHEERVYRWPAARVAADAWELCLPAQQVGGNKKPVVSVGAKNKAQLKGLLLKGKAQRQVRSTEALRSGVTCRPPQDVRVSVTIVR
jgi:hypothetical protein